MAELTIQGQKVNVDDSFMSLSPEQQNSTVDEIASSPAFQNSRQALAQKELNRRKAQAELSRRNGKSPIEVELPDGSIAEFPANMSKEEIQTVLARQFPSQGTQGASNQQTQLTPQPADKFTQAKRDFGNSAKSTFMQSLTLGTADNILAGLNTPIELATGAFSGEDSGKGFQERVADAYNRTAIPHNQGLDQYAKENPGKSLLASLGGGFMLGGGLASAGLTTAKLIPQGAGTLTRGAGTGAATAADGAILSGASEFFEGGSAEDVGNATKNGAIFGLGAGVASLPISAAAKATVDAFRRNFGGDEARAVQSVIQQMERSGVTREAAEAKLAELGSEGFLADALGAGGEDLARAASNASPQARSILESASNARIAAQPERVANALESASGLSSRLSPDELIQASRNQSQGRINQAYETARAAGHDLPIEPFEPLLKSQQVRDALKQGIKLTRERAIAQGGSNNVSRLSAFDEAKKVLDGKAQPPLGQKQTNEQAISAMLAKRLRETVDENVPEFAGARQLAQQAKQSEEAIKLGASGAKANIPLDFMRRIQGAHGNADEVAQGFASGKINQILNARPTGGTIDRFFGSPQQRETVQAIFKDKAPELFRKLANERTFNTTHKALTGNSSTARQLSEMLKFGIGTGGGAGIGAAGSLATGHDPLTGAATGAAIGAGGRIAQRAGQNFAFNQTEAAAPILARILAGHKVPKQLSQSNRATRAEISERLRLLLTGGYIAATAGAQ